MGLRFRKAVKVAPGVKVNIGTGGISTTVGPKGATVNLKKGRDPRMTVGLPGTGISYTRSLDDGEDEVDQDVLAAPAAVPEKTQLRKELEGAVGLVVFGLLLYWLFW